MGDPYRRETIEGWIGDFAETVAGRTLPPALQAVAPQVLLAFMEAACEAHGRAPRELEEADMLPGLLEGVAPLSLPGALHKRVPELVSMFLEALESQGRLGGGHALGLRVKACRKAYGERVARAATPIKRPGAKLGRNEPCPCGSGRKYKKCCMQGLA